MDKVDSVLFQKKGNHFRFYKKIDIDQDGFVSREDIKNYLIKKSIVNAEETEIYLNELKINENSLMSFNQFHSIFKENLSG